MTNRFPKHWDELAFLEAVSDVTAGSPKLQKQDYLTDGKYQVIDQGQATVGGYTDNPDLLAKVEAPTIIFGDHTRIFKYIEHPFCLGADGTKILEPKANLDRRFLFYYLSSLHIESAGYSRHFKFLKEKTVPVPSLEEQKRIAAILDKADAIRKKRQQAIQLADEFLRSVFLDMFGDTVDKTNWKEVSFSDVLLIDAPMVDPQHEPYTDMLHIGPDRIERDTGKLLPALTAREENLISKKFFFNESYVLYSKIRPYLKKVAIPNFSALCSADMYPVRPLNGQMTREYLWRLLLSDDFTQYTESLPARANIPKLNRNEMLGFRFQLPPLVLQEKFSVVVNKVFEIQDKNDKGLGGNLFESLSQKVFSGKL